MNNLYKKIVTMSLSDFENMSYKEAMAFRDDLVYSLGHQKLFDMSNIRSARDLYSLYIAATDLERDTL